MSDIDDQVAAFADDLSKITGIFDAQQIYNDTTTLVGAIATAPTHDMAAAELREFLDARPNDREYARTIAVGALATLGQYVVLHHPLDEFDGPDGVLVRLKRLAYAARVLGLQSVGPYVPGVL